MTHRDPFQPLTFCDSVILLLGWSVCKVAAKFGGMLGWKTGGDLKDQCNKKKK